MAPIPGRNPKPRRSILRRVGKALLWTVAVAGVLLGALLWWSPPPPVPAPPPPPVAKPTGPPLQANAEGFYAANYHFAVNDVRFTGFSLHPDTVVTFARAGVGTEESLGCAEAKIGVEYFKLTCDGPQGSTVLMHGRFLSRVATTRRDVPVVSAAVTVRSGSGEILYNARDRFEWRPGK